MRAPSATPSPAGAACQRICHVAAAPRPGAAPPVVVAAVAAVAGPLLPLPVHPRWPRQRQGQLRLQQHQSRPVWRQLPCWEQQTRQTDRPQLLARALVWW
jgi:hypothetical protein